MSLRMKVKVFEMEKKESFQKWGKRSQKKENKENDRKLCYKIIKHTYEEQQQYGSVDNLYNQDVGI